MVQHQLGRIDELPRSQRALDFAQDMSSRSLRIRSPSNSIRWLMAQVLYREAKQLMEGEQDGSK
jgi:hypothetical protein